MSRQLLCVLSVDSQRQNYFHKTKRQAGANHVRSENVFILYIIYCIILYYIKYIFTDLGLAACLARCFVWKMVEVGLVVHSGKSHALFLLQTTKNVCFLFYQSSKSSVTVDITYFRGAVYTATTTCIQLAACFFCAWMFLVFYSGHLNLIYDPCFSTSDCTWLSACVCTFFLSVPHWGTHPAPSSWLQLP